MKPATESKALTLAPPLTPAKTQPPTVIEMIDRVVNSAGGMTTERVAALTELVKLQERMEDRNAQKEFTKAFRDLQDELPAIVARTVIPNRGKYERYEDLMKVVGPLLRKYGFAVRFSQPMGPDGKPVKEPNHVTEICHLSHIGGHSESNSFTVRTGAKADSDTQADTKAASTAKRYAFANALNLVIRQDEDDASLLGHPINPEQAAELKRLVTQTGIFELSFFKYAGGKEPVKDYGSIMSGRYDELHDYLLQFAERKQKKPAQ